MPNDKDELIQVYNDIAWARKWLDEKDYNAVSDCIYRALRRFVAAEMGPFERAAGTTPTASNKS